MEQLTICRVAKAVIRVTSKVPRLVSWDESPVAVDMVEVDGSTKTLCLAKHGDKGETLGETLANRGGPSATVVGGSTAAGDRLPRHFFFHPKRCNPAGPETCPCQP